MYLTMCPCCESESRSISHWLDLPARSSPSTTMRAPRRVGVADVSAMIDWGEGLLLGVNV